MFLSHLYFLIFVQRRVERFGIGLASLLAKAEGERLERFCSAARISARSDKSRDALRATRRSGARSATERCHQPPGHKPKTGIKQALFPVGWMSLLALFIPFLLMQL
jgi:hypothetical protein